MGSDNLKRLKKMMYHYLKFVTKKLPHSEVIVSTVKPLVCSQPDHFSDIVALFDKLNPPPLCYLALRQEKPHPLATYDVAIEDEFVPSRSTAWKKEMKNSPKMIKRKAKQYEKDAVKELKRDNMVVNQERMHEKDWRKKVAKKVTHKVGEKGIRDEL